ncbi:MAG TPA: Do family serine endopeptidase [Gemmataceae bacterium]|nr:Do family serine endopeptidase [Gemmataceae bacterium]
MRRKSLVSVCLAVAVLVGAVFGVSYLKGQVKTPPAVPQEMTSYRDVVKKVLPAVVSIERRFKPVARTHSSNPGKQAPEMHKFFKQFDVPGLPNGQLPDELRKFFEDSEKQPFHTPESPRQHGFGSGFIIDPQGVIVTNHHVVNGADEVLIELRDGRKFVSKDIKSDPKTDLAIVRVETKEPLPHLTFGDSSAMEIGDRVLAVGAPFGLTGTVTQGIVSAKGRNLHLNMYEDFLQTDAAINPGNSGGPLVNLSGEVIGVNSAIKSRSGGWQGVGLAIASNMARNITQQLLKDGAVHRGYLGVSIKDLAPEVAARLGVDKQKGVLVAKVFDGSPAAKAGLKDGDVITALGGKPVENGRDLQIAVTTLPLNQPVSLTVIRDGERKDLNVTVTEQPSEFGLAGAPARQEPNAEKQSSELDKLGVEVSELTPELAKQFGYKEDVKGVVITQVQPDSPAADAGLHRGQLLVKVDKKRVKDVAAVKETLAKATSENGVLFQVRSPEGGTDIVLVKIPTAAAQSK